MHGSSGGRAAGRLWAWRELRRRWLALLTLGLLTGLAASVALAGLAGARRSEAAYDRLREETGGADAIIFASQVDIYAPDWAPIAALPYVEAAGSFGLPAVAVVDGPDGVDLRMLGVFSVPFGSWRTDVDRPVIVEGRAPDPDDPHEVIAPPDALDYGIEVGQTYVLALPSADQIAAEEFWSEPEGERVEVEVVGLGTSTFEMAVLPGGGGFVATQAFDDRYGQGITFIDNLLVRFRPGQGSIEQLERDARRILDSRQLPVLDAGAVAKRVTNGTEMEAAGLALFGIAVAVAGAVLVGQALTRSVRAGADDVPAFRAMGFSRLDAALALALPHALVAVVGAVVAFAGAVALSSRFPIGLSRRVDPDVGVHVDWLVLASGIALMVLVLVVTTAVTAYRSASRTARTSTPRRSRVVGWLGRIGAPPAGFVGASFALERGSDRRALPTRPALAGVMVGVIGVVGAQTLLVGMEDAIRDPSRFGATWDVETSVLDPSGLAGFEAAATSVDEVDGVRATGVFGRALIVFDGVTQPTYSIVPRTGTLDFTVLHGRRPVGRDEVVLGPETASAYGVDIGDVVTAVAYGGDEVMLEVVGTGLLPTTPHSSYDQGAWVEPGLLEALAGSPMGEYPPGVDPTMSTPPIAPTHVSVLDDGVDADAVVANINAALDTTHYAASPSTEPIDIANLRNVRSLPTLFAAFTVLLALGTMAHVSASVVRRRGTDLAVLRAIGMTPRGTRAALSWQATTLSVIGVLVGLPFGIALGRTIWRVMADLTPLVFSTPTALTAVVLAAPVTVLVANLIAAWPGQRAARIRPARLLRTE